LAFTAVAEGGAGAVVAGLAIVAGLVPGSATFAGALLSVDLQPFVTEKTPKRRIPKTIVDVLDGICPPTGSHLEFLTSVVIRISGFLLSVDKNDPRRHTKRTNENHLGFVVFVDCFNRKRKSLKIVRTNF
jgi:hypothetical protein